MSSQGLRAHTLGDAAHPLEPQIAWQELHRSASDRYRGSGRFAWHFARGKLGRDPVFRALLQGGAVPPQARVLDIGCGQGLLASLLAACDAFAAAKQWPEPWGAAPAHTRYTGIDLMPRDIARAQQALATLEPPPTLICGDMRTTPFPPCDVVVVLDVLHYVDIAAQDDVLARIRTALRPSGRLLLRVGDASQRWGFAASQWVDRIVTSVRGHRAPPTYGRTLEQWRATLQALGFAVQALPMSRGTPFANVLLRCEVE
ncbi:MAG: class I SAM-dependent methyltransferase [Burkholderiaceae bacterium]|nr:class I SAM-dependent methyltransferase [Burkholderiaceae bacterium]